MFIKRHIGYFFLQGLCDIFLCAVVAFTKYHCLNPKFKYIGLLNLTLTKCGLLKSLQLYVSVDAATKDSLKAIDRPLFGDFWERFVVSNTKEN